MVYAKSQETITVTHEVPYYSCYSNYKMNGNIEELVIAVLLQPLENTFLGE